MDRKASSRPQGLGRLFIYLQGIGIDDHSVCLLGRGDRNKFVLHILAHHVRVALGGSLFRLDELAAGTAGSDLAAVARQLTRGRVA